MGPALMHAQLTKQRIAALNGSLVFGSLGGLLVPVVGNFSLQVRQIWPSEVFVIVRYLRLFITFMQWHGTCGGQLQPAGAATLASFVCRLCFHVR